MLYLRPALPHLSVAPCATGVRHLHALLMWERRNTSAGSHLMVHLAGASGAQAAYKEGVTDDASLHSLRALRRTQRRQWWIALREMLRKSALIAGKAPHLRLLCFCSKA